MAAPLEIYWNLSNVKSWRLLGLFRPEEIRALSGLSCIDAYDENKISVIQMHGLASSSRSIIELVNRLLSDAEICAHNQFWYFVYPTGVAWTILAQSYRSSLAELRKNLPSV